MLETLRCGPISRSSTFLDVLNTRAVSRVPCVSEAPLDSVQQLLAGWWLEVRSSSFNKNDMPSSPECFSLRCPVVLGQHLSLLMAFLGLRKALATSHFDILRNLRDTFLKGKSIKINFSYLFLLAETDDPRWISKNH